MNPFSYWDILFRYNKLPCCLAELDTDLVLYYNEAMETLLEGRENILGVPFYDLISNDTMGMDKKAKLDWERKEHYYSKIFNKQRNQVFQVSNTLVQQGDQRYNLCQYRAIQTTKHFNYSFEEMMSRCITVSQENHDNKIPALLEILGEYYDADKGYLFQIDRQTMSIPCLSSWRKDNSIVLYDYFADNMDIQMILDWFENRNEMGIIEASETHTSYCLTSTEGRVLASLNLNNVLMSVIEDSNGEPLAIITVSNRKNLTVDLRLLQAVSRFIESDISKSEMKITLTQMSTTDLLTGFFSRSIYTQRLESIREKPPSKMGVIFANINGLKRINAEFGIAKGDSYIKKAAQELSHHFPTVEFYRISGDEFVGFFPEMEKEEFEQEINGLYQQLQQSTLEAVFALGHAWGSGRIDIFSLVKEADYIMYINKQDYYFKTNLSFKDITDSTLSDLLSYLADEAFTVYLQPQMLLKDGSLYGAEALVRRFDKENQKLVFPDQFIPLYEQKSVIRHVDIFVVEKVCQLLQKWANMGKLIPISVNLSRVTLQEFGIVRTIAKICDQYQLPREYLVIEVTERVGLVENNVASALISDFKEHGFKISLDDFGCAYSNIITLAQIEVDEVKIDKSLVDFLATDQKNRILVKNVLSMCHELENTSSLAEGIENEDQLAVLQEYDCHLGQGYFYSRPIPVDEFEGKYILSSEQ